MLLNALITGRSTVAQPAALCLVGLNPIDAAVALSWGSSCRCLRQLQCRALMRTNRETNSEYFSPDSYDNDFSELAASSTALPFAPVSAASSASDSGPRELATET